MTNNATNTDDRKAASRAASKAWRETNRERAAEYQREYRAAKKARLAAALNVPSAPTSDAVSGDSAKNLSYIHHRLTAVFDALTRIIERLDSIDRRLVKAAITPNFSKNPSPNFPPNQITTTKPKQKTKMFR